MSEWVSEWVSGSKRQYYGMYMYVYVAINFWGVVAQQHRSLQEGPGKETKNKELK